MMPTCCDPENQRVRGASRVPASYQGPKSIIKTDDHMVLELHVCVSGSDSAGMREAPRTREFSGSDRHFEELSSWTKNERVRERSRVPARFHGLTGS